MLKTTASVRLLKKVQMQGGEGWDDRGVQGCTSQGGTTAFSVERGLRSRKLGGGSEGGRAPLRGKPSPQMGLFQQPEREIGWISGRQAEHGASPAASANSRDPKNMSRPSAA